uniref:Uncharacterized protein n=1 Tax=Anguilla anguilla TaxID=7936 RepID=A0A0E9ULI1_ANGAN
MSKASLSVPYCSVRSQVTEINLGFFSYLRFGILVAMTDISDLHFHANRAGSLLMILFISLNPPAERRSSMCVEANAHL